MKKKKDEITIRSSAAEYLTYVASVGDQQDSIEMRYEDENIWLTQKMMATLYDVGTNTINYHIKKIFEDSELQEDSVIRKFRITAADGKSYSTIRTYRAMWRRLSNYPSKKIHLRLRLQWSLMKRVIIHQRKRLLIQRLRNM